MSLLNEDELKNYQPHFLAALQAGDQFYAMKLFMGHPQGEYKILFSLKAKYQADELLQVESVFLQLLEKAIETAVMDLQSGKMKSIQKAWGYVYKMIYFDCIDLLRHRNWGGNKASIQSYPPDTMAMAAAEEEPAETEGMSHLTTCWDNALKRLDPECKEVLLWIHGTERFQASAWWFRKSKVKNPKPVYGRQKDLATLLSNMLKANKPLPELELIFDWFKNEYSGKPNHFDQQYETIRQKVTRCASNMVQLYNTQIRKHPKK